MRYIKSFCLIILIVFSYGRILAEQNDVQHIFDHANELYNQGVYDTALIYYHQITKAGYVSDALLYNMGNAYFKMKDYPSSILYYEKALKLHPSDEAIRHNLALANTMIVDKIETLPEIFYKVWWRAFYTLLPADVWAWISVVLFALSLLLVYIYLTSFRTTVRKTAFFTALLTTVLFIGSFGLASQKYYYTQQTNEAIVFIPTITVKSSPSASSVDLFVIHEGTKVLLLDHLSDWSQIRIANGSTGWIPSEVLQGI
ncbi:MAG: tetratricopeptide repeat protein [Bacteroidales bacterium]|jgi:tetratricopeptide (TPR) repeat protein|nr:tetratricopeptide repeat protein [Bacteroidales bacterium]MDD3700551.1 tetratricopeptide repeat protein [Bacteroidales bacterium]MDY0368325.1 tetratricopeptide repeat protein [Bacteroidales bacterium]